MTEIPGLKVFPYIVEEAKGSNSKFKFFFVPHLAGGAVRSLVHTAKTIKIAPNLAQTWLRETGKII